MLSGCAAAGGFEPPLPGAVETGGWRVAAPQRHEKGLPHSVSETAPRVLNTKCHFLIVLLT